MARQSHTMQEDVVLRRKLQDQLPDALSVLGVSGAGMGSF